MGPNLFHQKLILSFTEIDSALEQQVSNVSQRHRVAHIHHHDQADDFRRRIDDGTGFEILLAIFCSFMLITG
jgi:hypothetical protein